MSLDQFDTTTEEIRSELQRLVRKAHRNYSNNGFETEAWDALEIEINDLLARVKSYEDNDTMSGPDAHDAWKAITTDVGRLWDQAEALTCDHHTGRDE